MPSGVPVQENANPQVVLGDRGDRRKGVPGQGCCWPERVGLGLVPVHDRSRPWSAGYATAASDLAGLRPGSANHRG
jgi:hypothetical protein